MLRGVPWLAGGVGYFHAFQAPLSSQALWSNDVHLFAAVGLDYALTRQLGLGGTARYGFLLGLGPKCGARSSDARVAHEAMPARSWGGLRATERMEIDESRRGGGRVPLQVAKQPGKGLFPCS